MLYTMYTIIILIGFKNCEIVGRLDFFLDFFVVMCNLTVVLIQSVSKKIF